MAPGSQSRDEDDISVTSTVSDQYSADDEFEVDRILAEKDGPQSGKFYLISWLDYPIEKATWEPAVHVGPECLDVWKERLQREKDGLEQPFNIEEWEAKLLKAENEKADRKRRREAKRKRLRKANLQALAEKIAGKPSDSDASSSEAMEENLVDADRGQRTKRDVRRKKAPARTPQARKPPPKAAVKGTSFEELDDELSKADARIEEMQIGKSSNASNRAREISPNQYVSDSDEDLPLAQISRIQPRTQPVSSTSGSSAQVLIKAPPTKLPTTAQSSSAVGPPAASRPPSIRTTRETPHPPGVLSNKAGKRATRGGPNIARNVFETREPVKLSANLLTNAMKTSIEPKVFGNISHRRKAELQGRDLAERPPDLEVLGGLFDPSEPASMQPVKPSDIRKLPSSTSNRAYLDKTPARNDLFLSRSETPNPEVPSNHIPTPPRPNLHLQTSCPRPVCFFWDRQQKHMGGPCQNGESCRFEHTYHYGLTVAAPPDHWAYPAPELSLPISKHEKNPTNDIATSATGKSPASTSSISQKERDSRPLICFFWDRWMKNARNPPCVKGSSCTRDHTYEYGQPIAGPPRGYRFPASDQFPVLPQSNNLSINKDNNAPTPEATQATDLTARAQTSIKSAPPGFTAPDRTSDKTTSAAKTPAKSEQPVCFFWDRAQKSSVKLPCKNGDHCKDAHTHEFGTHISPAPPGFSSHDHNAPHIRHSDHAAEPDTNAASALSTVHLRRPLEPKTHVCPFWDAEQRNSSKYLPCTEGANCRYLHTYIGGFPIGGAVCFFWDQNQKNSKCPPCAEGPVNCMYRHSYGENAPIAPAPLDYRPPFPADRPQWSPANPRNAICYLFFHGRECDTSTCSFFHSMEPGMAIAPSPEGQAVHAATRKDEKYQSYIQSASSVNEENSVLIETAARTNNQPGRPPTPHLALSSIARDREPPPRSSAISNRPAWDPRDPQEAVCFFWYKGSCKKGVTCNYIHDLNSMFPIAPPPWDHTAAKTCLLWAEGRCPEMAKDCRNLHEYVEPASALGRGSISNFRAEKVYDSTNHFLIGSRKKSVNFAEDLRELTQEPASVSPGHRSLDHRAPALTIPGHPVACRFFKKGSGYCENGASCRFSHDYPEQPDIVSVNNEPSRIRQISTGVPNGIQSKSETLSVTIDEDVDMLGSDVSQLEVDNQTHVAPRIASENPSSKLNGKMINAGEKIRQKATESLSARVKEVVFGSDESRSLFLDFGDLKLEESEPWKLALTSDSKINFHQICLAQDVKSQQGLIMRQKLWCGSLTAADPEHSEMHKSIDQVVDELVLRAAGLVSTFAGFAILIFPSKKEEWRFLEDFARYSFDAPLRYMIFRHENNLNQSRDSPSKVGFGKPFRKMLMSKIHGLRLNNLVPKYGKDQNPFKFYLLLPQSEEQSLDFFSAWIRASNPESQIFDCRTKGSWDFFLKNHEGFGVILIHDSLVGTISQLPSVRKLLMCPGIVMWNVSDSTSLYPRFPSMSWEPESELGTIKFTRLFPHGCAFLLTPSFLVAEPELSHDLLRWFFLKFKSSTPGTWKLVCCSKFKDYILDLADAKVMEKEAFEKIHRDDPARESMLKQKKLSYDLCELRYKIHTLVAQAKGTFYPPGHGDGGSESDSGFNEDMDGPLVEAPAMIDQDDEEQLVMWFAAWSMQKLDVHRKFGVIGTNQENAVRAKRIKLKPPTKPPLSVEKQKARDITDRYYKLTSKKLDPIRTHEVTENLSDSSMAVDLGIPVISKHSIDGNQPEDVLEFVSQTGSPPEDAKRYLAKANNNVSTVLEMHKREDLHDQVVKTTNSESCRPLRPLTINESDLQRAVYNDTRREMRHTKPKGTGDDTPGIPRGRPELEKDAFHTDRVLVAQRPVCKIGSTTLDVRAGDRVRLIKFVSGKRHYALNLRTNERGQVHEDLFHPEPAAADHDRAPLPSNCLATTRDDYLPQHDSTSDTRSSSGNKRTSSVANDTSSHRFVPGSLASHDTSRPERSVKSGFVPEQEKEAYESQCTMDEIPLGAVGSKPKEGLGHKGSVESASLTSNGSVRPPKRARREHPDPGYETKEFRATSAWYRELCEAEKGWEHIAILTDWAEAKKFLHFK
ncbi:hypothetical protein PZA11_003320 [Diplocarpon coronariae]